MIKNIIILVETAFIAWILGAAYQAERADNDKDYRKELKDTWTRQESEEN